MKETAASKKIEMIRTALNLFYAFCARLAVAIFFAANAGALFTHNIR